jgi:hypothetical protein
MRGPGGCLTEASDGGWTRISLPSLRTVRPDSGHILPGFRRLRLDKRQTGYAPDSGSAHPASRGRPIAERGLAGRGRAPPPATTKTDSSASGEVATGYYLSQWRTRQPQYRKPWRDGLAAEIMYPVVIKHH